MDIKEGDIIAFEATTIQKALLRLIEPYSDRWHFVLVGDPIDDDFEIYESLPSGIKINRLSYYRGRNAKVYRVEVDSIAHKAAEKASLYGRYGYDYVLFLWLFWTAIKYWLVYGFRKVPYWVFKNEDNKSLICTELVKECFDSVGYPLFEKGIIPTPSAFQQSVLERRLNKVYEGVI